MSLQWRELKIENADVGTADIIKDIENRQNHSGSVARRAGGPENRLFPRRAQWWYPAYPCGRWQYVTPAYSPAYIYQVTAEDGTEYSYTTSGGSKEWKTQSQLTGVSSTG